MAHDHHHHDQHHHHHHGAHANERHLKIALALTASVLVVELVGGLIAESLALVSDAAHMFTDTCALAIALAALGVGKRSADTRRTFGYNRFEILAATLNALLLIAVAVYIVIEAGLRLRHPPEIRSDLMLGVAVLGFIANFASMRLLSGEKDDNLNMKGAYLEVWSDMLGSLGVIAGALVIRWTGWTWVDTLVAIGIGAWVLPRTWRLLHESLNILLEGVPVGVALSDIRKAIGECPGVAGVHDLHVWAISSGKVSLTVHVVAACADGELLDLSSAIRTMLARRFDIHHSTVQLEREPCEQGGDTHVFTGSHAHDHGGGPPHQH